MKCDKCKSHVKSDEEREYNGQILCEDCYMDALSPVRTCDPWAVYAAKSMSNNGAVLTKRQEDILSVLEKTNGIELEPLADRLDLKLSDLQREIATLRHMEKLKAAMEGDKKVFRLWE